MPTLQTHYTDIDLRLRLLVLPPRISPSFDLPGLEPSRFPSSSSSAKPRLADLLARSLAAFPSFTLN